MTKKLIKLIIVGYQNISRSPLPTCRFNPTCSQYCLESIEKFGILKGTYLGAKRILSCHPFSKRPVYDPV